MSDSGTDQRTVAAKPNDGDPLSPADLAARVATLVGDGARIQGGELPLWDRLGKPQRRPAWRSRLLPVLAWWAMLGLLVVAVLRMFCHDATVPLTWLNAFTLYLYLPAYLVLALAAWTGRWWLATASAAVVACHLTWVLPDFRAATPYVPPNSTAADAPRSIRIFYVNVRTGNLNVKGVLDEALSADADVVIIAEVQRWWLDQLRASEIPQAYPFGTNVWKRHGGDVNVFSRLPVSRLEQITAETRACIVVDIPLGSETLRLFAIHSPRPLVDPLCSYERFWQKLEPILTEQQGPVVAVGDFNATQHSLVFEQLKADGMRSAHEDRGRGYATTWPNGLHWIPPIRIDQAFLSPEVECVSIAEGIGPGSDHKPLILDIRVHASAPAGTSR
ncbi:MAG: endonuclease/exonuclease/phosphatase family protein [Pirellulales bacterium]